MLWGVIVCSSVIVDFLDAELGKIVRVRVLRIKVRRRSVDELWLDELCRAASRSKQTSLVEYAERVSSLGWLFSSSIAV